MAAPLQCLSQRLVNWARIKSPWITLFNSGACNACDIEIIACLMPRFDIERFGILAKGSPRHADILIVTGHVTLKQASRLRRVWEQIPEPRYVIAMGACGASAGAFHGLYHVMERVEDVIPVDVYAAGCPPRGRSAYRMTSTASIAVARPPSEAMSGAVGFPCSR